MKGLLIVIAIAISNFVMADLKPINKWLEDLQIDNLSNNKPALYMVHQRCLGLYGGLYEINISNEDMNSKMVVSLATQTIELLANNQTRLWRSINLGESEETYKESKKIWMSISENYQEKWKKNAKKTGKPLGKDTNDDLEFCMDMIKLEGLI